MAAEERTGTEDLRTAPLEDIPGLLLSCGEAELRHLIENPSFDETHVCLLLERKDLPGSLIEEIAKRKTWRGIYRVRRSLAAHPHTPRLIAVRVLRDLHLMDLVRVSLLPASSGELRRLAEERVLVQLPQLPLGQRLMLARRGSARVAAGLILHGPENVARVALDNPFLNESQLLKTLSKQSLTARTVASVAKHEKWSKLINVRVVLLRHAHAPAGYASALASDLPRRDIEDLLGLTHLSAGIREELQQELARRDRQEQC
ncbi:MAG: hypothetical protein LAO08_12680 [Acidobacteriia bacterium]|nr:hypothetical protein [Terriglobia bacterium]